MASLHLLLLAVAPSAASLADKIGNFDPYDTLNRFHPAASAQDAAQRGFCQKPVAKELRFDVAPDWEMANTICCHNTKYAEPSGYFNTPRIHLFSRFKSEENSHTFYDSVCGIPLFTAPVGRSMAEWQAESMEHGWPSFRPAEVVGKNVVQYPNGEVRSACGTHLGHNLPDRNGPRYCIDLVCVSGYPAFGTEQEPRIAAARGRPGHEHVGSVVEGNSATMQHIGASVRKLKGLVKAKLNTIGRGHVSPTSRSVSSPSGTARRLLSVSVVARHYGGVERLEELREREQREQRTAQERERERLKEEMQAHADLEELRLQNDKFEEQRQRLINDNKRLAQLLVDEPKSEIPFASVAGGAYGWILLFMTVSVTAVFLSYIRRSRCSGPGLRFRS